MTASRRARLMSATVIGSSARYLSAIQSTCSLTASMRWARASSTSSTRSGRDGVDVVAGAERLVLVDDGLAVDQVDDALEAGIRADGELDGDGVGAEALADVGDGAR